MGEEIVLAALLCDPSIAMRADSSNPGNYVNPNKARKPLRIGRAAAQEAIGPALRGSWPGSSGLVEVIPLAPDPHGSQCR